MKVTTAYERVLNALSDVGKDYRDRGDSAAAQCPAHDDHRPSLTVTRATDRALVCCNAGCNIDDVLGALNLTRSDLFDHTNGKDPLWSPYGPLVAIYDYVDATGHLLFQVCRTSEKQFPQRRPDSTAKGGWNWKLGDTPRVLYRLPKVLAAVADGEAIYVVEGEKDVHSIEAQGHVATCNPGGAKKWRHEYAEVLRGADVIIVCDRDTPGRAHGRMVEASLRGVAGLVRLVEPAEGKDVTDHLAAGYDLEQLAVVPDSVDDGPPLEEPDDEPDEQAEPLSAIDQLRQALIHGNDVEQIPPPEPLVTEWLDLESLAVLYGRPGGGKSFVSMDLSLHIATGSWWHGHEVAAGHVLYIAAEGKRGLGIRQRAWRSLNNIYSDIERMHYLPRVVNLLDPVFSAALAQIASEIQPRLVVIDTLARSMPGGDENTGKDMGQVIAAADRIKNLTGACILIVHHSGKDQTQGARGHSSLLGAVDTELELKNGGDGILVLSNTKQKEALEQPPLRLALIPREESAAVARYTGRRGAEHEDISTKTMVTLDALRAIALPGGIATTTWREQASGSGTGRSSFYEHVKVLSDRGLVRNIGSDSRPLYIPSEQVEQ